MESSHSFSEYGNLLWSMFSTLILVITNHWLVSVILLIVATILSANIWVTIKMYGSVKLAFKKEGWKTFILLIFIGMVWAIWGIMKILFRIDEDEEEVE